MYTVILIIALILGACIVPYRKRFMYLYLSVFLLAFLAFFMWPDNDYDLYRHYLTLNKYKTLNLQQVLNIAERSVGTGTIEWNVNSYINAYPVYSLYAWLISKIGLYQLLPFLTIVTVYGLAVYRIRTVAIQTQNYGRSVVISYIFVLICYNYIFVTSNIRQPLSNAIFAFALYEELVNKRNKAGCFVIYILACFIHSSAYMFLALRILLIFYHKSTRFVIITTLLTANHILPTLCNQLLKVRIRTLSMVAEKYLNYTVMRANANGKHVSYKLLIMYIMILLLLLLFTYGSTCYKHYKKYCTIIMLSIFFVLSMTNQSDIFNRFEFFVIPLIIPIVQELLCEYSGQRIFSAKISEKKYKYYILMIAVFSFIAVTNWGIACIKSYSTSTHYYSICNFMHNGSFDLPPDRVLEE